MASTALCPTSYASIDVYLKWLSKSYPKCYLSQWSPLQATANVPYKLGPHPMLARADTFVPGGWEGRMMGGHSRDGQGCFWLGVVDWIGEGGRIGGGSRTHHAPMPTPGPQSPTQAAWTNAPADRKFYCQSNTSSLVMGRLMKPTAQSLIHGMPVY